jgi:acetyl-CoA synthetase/medium-chain acyl-CoA synthetase
MAVTPEELQSPEYFNFAVDVVDRWAKQAPASLALWCVDAASDAQTRLTFADVSRLSCQAATLFRNAGIKPGDRVLLMLPRISPWWIATLGLIRLGAIPIPATLLLTTRDLNFRLATARVAAVLTDTDGLPKLVDFDGIRILVGGDAPGWIDFRHALAQASPVFRPEPTRGADASSLYFTSATTGEPKMVLHTQASYGIGHRLTGRLWLDLRPGDLHWNISDLGWAKAAWSSFYAPWQMGACVFALDFRSKFNPAQALDTLARFPITTWCAPPTALRLIVRQEFGNVRFPKLRHCVTAGEPLNPEVFNSWRSRTGLELHEAYGQTETVVLIGNFRCLNRPIRPGSMGVANPAFQVEMLGDDLKPVPTGTEGEIALRIKPNRPLGLFREYWLNPSENAQKFRGDYYLTGDRAVRDEEGYFWFVGRKDDVIKSSGYRIGPFEVESALLEHPAVLEAAVIGKPDPLRGQIVKAYVVPRAEVDINDDLKAEIQQHCKQLVAAYKYPREIEFVDELPKTISGKTRHFALRQQFAAR